MSEIRRYKVSRMSCGGCSATVTGALQALDGCEAAQVDLESGQATVSGPVSVEAVLTALQSAGYPGELLDG